MFSVVCSVVVFCVVSQNKEETAECGTGRNELRSPEPCVRQSLAMHVVEVCGTQVEGQSESESVLVVCSCVIHGEAVESTHGHMKQAPLMPLYQLKSKENVCSLCF